MKTRSKFLIGLFNVALLGVLAWIVLRLVYAPAGMSLELTSDMEDVSVGEFVELRFVIHDAEGEVVTDFDRVHEKLLHLIAVREDLTQFQHLHPELDKETGEFSVDLRFEAPGPYQLFADFTPANSTQMVLPLSMEVGSLADYTGAPLTLSAAEAFSVDGFTVTPHFPESIQPGQRIEYSFDVTKDGAAVTLEDYLGAKGHSVVLSEGELTYIHTHPEGETLSFETAFESTGVYKSFTQFQVGGRVYTIEYVFEVKGEDVEDRGDSMEGMGHSSH